jgi:hypothetical protein
VHVSGGGPRSWTSVPAAPAKATSDQLITSYPRNTGEDLTPAGRAAHSSSRSWLQMPVARAEGQEGRMSNSNSSFSQSRTVLRVVT